MCRNGAHAVKSDRYLKGLSMLKHCFGVSAKLVAGGEVPLP